MSDTRLPYLDGSPVECWHCHGVTRYGLFLCDQNQPVGCGAQVREPPTLSVTEVSQGIVTLHSTYVGGEYNYANPIMLDADEARRVLAELTAAVESADVNPDRANAAA
jgi:hypothetical protein